MAVPDTTQAVPLQAVPGWAMLLLAAAGIALSVTLSRLRETGRSSSARAALLAARAAATVAATWLALLALGRAVTLLTHWPLWVVALLGGCALQATRELYRFERGALEPRAGQAVTLLRLAAVALALLMLAQPVWKWTKVRVEQRALAVLVDESESMQSPAGAAGTESRTAAARAGLLTRTAGAEGVLRTLSLTYRTRLWRFGAQCVESDPAKWAAAGATDGEALTNAAFRMGTDIAQALETADRAFPAGTLAGVLLVSDGRHNAASDPAAAARRLGVTGAPVLCLATGSNAPPCDASILALRAPDSVYAGDKVRVAADLKFDGLRGRSSKVTLFCDEKPVDQVTVQVADDRFRCGVTLTHQVETNGISAYRLAVEPERGEIRDDNNAWRFDVAVTDDRTRVLVVDSYPRWEFRYLRNLFYGRDKSVQLQYLLLNPETIDGAPEPAAIPAAADRPYGDAQATRWPKNEEEWKKFDVIILGDVRPDAFDEQRAGMVARCVAERGALLVCIAGPRSMPHAFHLPAFEEMLPVSVASSRSDWFRAPEESYRVELTAQGRAHPATLLAADPEQSVRIWSELPPLSWRHGGLVAKPDASVLACAVPVGAGVKNAAGAAASDGSLEALAGALAAQRERESKNVLLAARSYGLGRVVFLGFDETWRLRYRVGDTYHHRFWGQLVRWGTGGPLRGGGANLRIGSERLTYSPSEPVRVLARLRGKDQAPILNAEPSVQVWDGKRLVEEKPLAAVDGGQGMHEALVGPLPPGTYRLALAGGKMAKVLAELGGPAPETEVLVQAVRNPIEIADLSPNHDLLARIATLGNGRVVSQLDAAEIAKLFGPGTRRVEEEHCFSFWDSGLLLALFVGCLCAEWILRKKAGVV